MWNRTNNENKTITGFIFATKCLYTNGHKKVRILKRIKIQVLKIEIQSREVERDPGASYEVRGGSFYNVSGVFKIVYGANKSKFWESSLGLVSREILIILSV